MYRRLKSTFLAARWCVLCTVISLLKGRHRRSIPRTFSATVRTWYRSFENPRVRTTITPTLRPLDWGRAIVFWCFDLKLSRKLVINKSSRTFFLGLRTLYRLQSVPLSYRLSEVRHCDCITAPYRINSLMYSRMRSGNHPLLSLFFRAHRVLRTDGSLVWCVF